MVFSSEPAYMNQGKLLSSDDEFSFNHSLRIEFQSPPSKHVFSICVYICACECTCIYMCWQWYSALVPDKNFHYLSLHNSFQLAQYRLRGSEIERDRKRMHIFSEENLCGSIQNFYTTELKKSKENIVKVSYRI